MSKTPIDQEVFYQAPGESEWRPTSEVQAARRGQASGGLLRGQVRELLELGDASAREVLRVRRRSRRRSEQEARVDFESDMARALHAWGRYVEVESKRLYERAGDLLSRAVKRGR